LTLAHYLGHDDVWAIIQRSTSSASELLFSYTDGLAFKQHGYFSVHPGALRLHFYIDEVKLCNPIGSAKKKHNITTVYHQVGNVEQKYLSLLTSIHVAIIVKTCHLKKYGFLAVAQQLINDLQLLENSGMKITANGQSTEVFGSVATVSSDNLGSHDFGGFRCCFSSGRICRFCMASYDQLSHFTSESDEQYPKHHTADEHKKHVTAVLGDSRLCSVYDVQKLSNFSALESFDVYKYCIHVPFTIGWISVPIRCLAIPGTHID